MDRKVVFQLAGGALAGLLIATAAWSVQATDATTKAKEAGSNPNDDMDSLRAANTKLVEAQHEADKTIAELRARLPEPPAAPSPPPAPGMFPEGGLPAMRPNKEVTAEDWERMATHGGVSYMVPCLRAEPWTPPKFLLNRLGLAPQDAAMIHEAYEHSNKRVADVVRPLCVKTLGKSDAPELIGLKGCLDAVLNHAKAADTKGTDEALVRVARANAGKTDVKRPDGPPGFEQMLLAITREVGAFEAEIASKLGPEEAKRLTLATEMCMDRGFVRARPEGP